MGGAGSAFVLFNGVEMGCVHMLIASMVFVGLSYTWPYCNYILCSRYDLPWGDA